MNSCGEGRVMSTDQKGCMDRNECLDLPCMNGASCINLEPKFRYRCVCLDGFWGENCQLVQEGQTLKLSMGALAAILVCLLIILSEQFLQTFTAQQSSSSSIIITFYCYLYIVYLCTHPIRRMLFTSMNIFTLHIELRVLSDIRKRQISLYKRIF